MEHVANINAVSLANLTPLTAAVTWNSHGVLKLLLERWFEYSECPRLKGLHLVKTLAMYGDVTTMDILSRTDHLLSKYDKEYLNSDYRSLLQARLEFNESLEHAFEELLRIMRLGSESSRLNMFCPSFHSSRGPSPLHMESGFCTSDDDEVEDVIREAADESEDGSNEAFEDAVETQ